MRFQGIQSRSALNRTSGFLGGGEVSAAQEPAAGFTHSFNPAVGCRFAKGFCGSFCYASEFAERLGGAGTWGEVVLSKENSAELLEEELARAGRRPAQHPLHLSRLRVFSASTTDPCIPPVLEIYRACLRVLARYRVARWVVQTRSPQVLELEPEILALGETVTVSFTIETDDAELWSRGPAGAPGIQARRRAFEAMEHWPVRRHLAVSPCLPLRDALGFADWIAEHATDATVDTFLEGDGSGGRRTARSALPGILAEQGFDWRSDEHAHALFAALRERMGERVGWSKLGFRRLAT